MVYTCKLHKFGLSRAWTTDVITHLTRDLTPNLPVDVAESTGYNFLVIATPGNEPSGPPA